MEKDIPTLTQQTLSNLAGIKATLTFLAAIFLCKWLMDWRCLQGLGGRAASIHSSFDVLGT